MGTWAEGNFDNDTALDFVSDIAKEVAKEMTPPPDAVEDIDLVVAAVAVHKALVEHCKAPPPKRDQIESLKAAVLSLYDNEIDALEPASDYKTARRRIIADTFDELLTLIANRMK